MKVAVCLPVKSGVHPSAMRSLLTAWSAAKDSGIDMALVQTDRSPVASARNDLVRRALSINPDRIWFVDSDMVFPPETLIRLLQHDKDAVACFYPVRQPPYEVVGLPLDRDCPDHGLQRAKQFGMGLALFKPSVFETLSPPWFMHLWGVEAAKGRDNEDGEMSEDISFCRRAVAAGIELWVDLDLSYEVGHICDSLVVITADQIGKNDAMAEAAE